MTSGGLITRRSTIRGDLVSPPIQSEAIFSPCELYRYWLSWRWSDAPALYVWMLNPSTATNDKLDATCAGLVSRAKKWGYGAVIVLNLFAYRATQPVDMKRHPDPVGPANDAMTALFLGRALDDGSPVVVAWGTDGKHRGREAWAVEQARRAGVRLFAFCENGDGSPHHPLRISYDLRPQPWQPREVAA